MVSPHLIYLRECLMFAKKSPPRPTNFRVGALLVSRKEGDYRLEDDLIISTGYTMELAGNTHAEQCCLSNYAAVHSVPDERVWEVLPSEPGRKLVMYVTMEPCGKRLSGNLPCVQRIIQTRQGGRKGIEKVYFGVKEPGTFVGGSQGCKMLTEAGIEWQVVNGLEKDILKVAVEGHENREAETKSALDTVETNIDDISDDERRRQQEVKRNPKKKMVQVDLLG
ncbi:cytidine deaminase-like protein [Aspergillus avenaceus]|uniref:Cytidine deaminase-like protein n=1 Tax=Aspergillus avenaceus TaxID=36643 RepID=A0A5N6TD05_ASPAV|nr:cytidine deaminase-like protein [Aspergillus avenaceus]